MVVCGSLDLMNYLELLGLPNQFKVHWVQDALGHWVQDALCLQTSLEKAPAASAGE